MTRKADIMYALENFEKSKALIKEGMVSTAILRVDTGIQWLCKALDIEPSDAALAEILAKDDAP
jgi:hypothetical protein